MIEQVKNKKKLYALIVRSKYRKKKGVNFFTNKNATQQFGYMNHKKEHLILPHRHNKRQKFYSNRSDQFKGQLRVDFYDNKENIYSVKNFIQMT